MDTISLTWPATFLPEGFLLRGLGLAGAFLFGLACAMARVLYYRRPEKLPPADDAEAMGQYWKAHYNTEEGAGTVPSFVLTFNEHIKPLYEER